MADMVYVGGHMLNLATKARRQWEKSELKRLGFKVYNPVDNKKINSKTETNLNNLAETIVEHDLQAINESDILIFDVADETIGTACEVAYLQGLKHQGIEKKVYIHSTDIRRTGRIAPTQDRQEWSMNQYYMGVILDVTDGRGIQTWDEITKDLIRNHGGY